MVSLSSKLHGIGQICLMTRSMDKNNWFPFLSDRGRGHDANLRTLQGYAIYFHLLPALGRHILNFNPLVILKIASGAIQNIA